MEDLPYLFRLDARLSTGLAAFSPGRRIRHRDFILRHQQPDGGFRGREGESDLYYTAFATRALRMLDMLDPETVQSIGTYLDSFTPLQFGVIDLMNWFSTALIVQLADGRSALGKNIAELQPQFFERLESVRTRDGGYAKSPEGASGSTYHSFLVLLTYQLLGTAPPRPQALAQFIYDRQRDDGGFVEIAPMRRSGTNPTAAAVAILRELNALDEEVRGDVAAFLAEVRDSEGGFQANSRVPFADGLSTFTAILTAQDLSLEEVYNSELIHDWVTTQLEFPTGGFRAAAWDEAADVEYTFYGLGILSLLNRSAR